MQHAWPWIAGALIGAGPVWLLYRLRAIARVGAGYKAKILCTALFASRRQMDVQRADEIWADAYWLLRPFRASVDDNRRSVTASLFGLHARTAVHRAGYGATLLASDTPLVALTSGTSPRELPVTPPLPHRAGSDRLRQVVERAFEEPNPKRLRRTHAVLVMQDGAIIAEQYARGVRADTPLPGWSMTKSVLNALIGLVVVEGLLRLDERELFPAWRAPDPRSAIQVEDLLRMRSGLRFSEDYGKPTSDVVQMLFNCGNTAAYAASRPLAARPGQVWQYASGTTNLLSAIVRRTVGDEAYAIWPRRVLFDRAGLDSAVLEPDAAGTFVCSSFMLATTRDWARYGQLWLDRGRRGHVEILPDWWVDFSTTPTPQSPDNMYGAHWWLKLQPEVGGNDPAALRIAPDAFFAVGHEGQTLTVIPSRRLVVVRMGAAIYADAWNHARFIADIQEAL